MSGGTSSGSPVENVLTNLLRRAIADGPSKAARAFVDCTSATSCSFYRFYLLTGISIPEPFEVFDGITLMPLPESTSELPPHLPYLRTEADQWQRISVADLLGKTLVRVEYDVQPIFHRPAQCYTFQSGPERHFRIKLKYRGVATELPTETWQRLRIPIDRWAKAMAEDNPIDQIIDLGISLECLYVPDSQGEVSFRFALHGAWHLGKEKAERQALGPESATLPTPTMMRGVFSSRGLPWLQ